MEVNYGLVFRRIAKQATGKSDIDSQFIFTVFHDFCHPFPDVQLFCFFRIFFRSALHHFCGIIQRSQKTDGTRCKDSSFHICSVHRIFNDNHNRICLSGTQQSGDVSGISGSVWKHDRRSHSGRNRTVQGAVPHSFWWRQTIIIASGMLLKNKCI